MIEEGEADRSLQSVNANSLEWTRHQQWSEVESALQNSLAYKAGSVWASIGVGIIPFSRTATLQREMRENGVGGGTQLVAMLGMNVPGAFDFYESGYTAWTGTDLFSGQEVAGWVRGVNGAGVALSALPIIGTAYRGVNTAINSVAHAVENAALMSARAVSRTAQQAVRITRRIPGLLNTGFKAGSHMVENLSHKGTQLARSAGRAALSEASKTLGDAYYRYMRKSGMLLNVVDDTGRDFTRLAHQIEGAAGSVEDAGGALKKAAGAADAAESAVDASNTLNNKQLSRLTEGRVQAKLEARFGKGNVLSERTLRDATGKKVVDPVTGTGRRIDFVVLDDAGNIRFRVEVTSRNQANNFGKLDQLDKELRIEEAGGVFVRRPGSRDPSDLIDISGVETRVIGVGPL